MVIAIIGMIVIVMVKIILIVIGIVIVIIGMVGVRVTVRVIVFVSLLSAQKPAYHLVLDLHAER